MSAKRAEIHRCKMKVSFYKNTKEHQFKVDDIVLRWDSRREENGKHTSLTIFGFVLLGLLKF